eukprot:COSAG02_NODE_17766_length_982_cov_2.633069_1_plen_64_part_00
MQTKNELFDTVPNYVTKNNDHSIKICARRYLSDRISWRETGHFAFQIAQSRPQRSRDDGAARF